MNDIYIVTITKLSYCNTSSKLELFHREMLQKYSKVFKLENIQPGNELSTNRHRSADRYLPTTDLSHFALASLYFCMRIITIMKRMAKMRTLWNNNKFLKCAETFVLQI